MPHRRTSARPGQGHWAILLGALLASVSFSPSFALDNVRRETQHFFECFGLMLKSPDQHAGNCLPNRVVGPNGSIQSTSGGDYVAPPPVTPPPPPVVVAPPPPVVVEPPPPPPAPDPCNCGCDYAV